jgi:phosphatidylserine/phosphatidylglycerophosphate/cardiolipin synthase-like enzyme
VDFKNLNITLDKQHFYLQGRFLDELSKDLMENAQAELIVVNPFVKETDLAKTLIYPAQDGVKTILITRKPDQNDNFHKFLQSKGVVIRYNDRVHAKLILVDKTVGFITSMNFIPTSSSGQSWEAGIVTLSQDVISDIIESIYELLE